jgi:GT2 family glycosyltransferase
MPQVLISVIIPVDRPGLDADRAIAAVLAQSHRNLELVLVGAAPPASPDARVRVIVEPDRNPALRRNRAAELARGEILAFVDDDAFADERWLESALSIFGRNREIIAVGGPDPAPADSPAAELISDMLLATPLIGSGIACHESRRVEFDVRAPHDIALVNLFVRTDSFRAAGGFDESIGYVGEDSELIARLLKMGRVLYSPLPVVYHRRRTFPRAFIGQRWRYRVKTGQMLVSGKGSAYRRSGKLLLFLAAGVVFLATVVLAPKFAALMLLVYAVLTLLLGGTRARFPRWMLLLVPLFFLIHHAVYFVGIVWGALRGLGGRAYSPPLERSR